jgi:hypothetical protein
MGFTRKYSLNESFFENIDSEEKAYVLGFVYADGNNKTQGSGLMFTLNTEDIEILEKIKKALNSDAKISIYETSGYKLGKCAHIDFNSYKISKDLTDKGAPPNKTYKIVFPLFLEEKLIPHFIRGYFDGDGCIWNGKRKKMHVKDSTCKNGYKDRIVHNVKFTLTSNTNFILGIQNHLIEKLGFKRTKLYYRHKDNKSIATLEYSGRGNIKKLYDYMYKDATIFLERKFKKFNEILCAFDGKLSNETELIAGNPLEP